MGLNSSPYIDPVPGAADAEGIEELAVRLTNTAEFLEVIGSGQVVAEVPGHRLEFWALGFNQAEATQELLKVVRTKLWMSLAGRKAQSVEVPAR